MLFSLKVFSGQQLDLNLLNSVSLISDVPFMCSFIALHYIYYALIQNYWE